MPSKEGEKQREDSWKIKENDLPSNARDLTLALFVLGDGTNDHYPAVATNHPTLVAHSLD